MPLPPPDQPIDIKSYHSTWPLSAKCELLGGEVFWQGKFTEADLERARAAFPGRPVVLEKDCIRLTWIGSEASLADRSAD